MISSEGCVYTSVCIAVTGPPKGASCVEKRCITFCGFGASADFGGIPLSTGILIHRLWVCVYLSDPDGGGWNIPLFPEGFGEKYAAYASAEGRNPGAGARIYRRMGFSPQGCGCSGPFVHNLSKAKDAGRSRAAATFPQFPHALLLLLKYIISTTAILILGGDAYSSKEAGSSRRCARPENICV